MLKQLLVYIVVGILSTVHIMAENVAEYSSTSYLSPGGYFKLTDNFTIEVWAYKSTWDTPTAGDQPIYSVANNGGYSLKLKTNGNISFQVWDGSSSYDYFSYPISNLTDGWHHFAVTVTDADPNYYYFLVDGTVVSSGVGTANDITYDDDNYFLIGAEAGPGATPEGGQWFSGKLDEFRFWTTYLEPDSIQAWMHCDLSAYYNPSYVSSLYGYYKFQSDWAYGWLDDAAENIRSEAENDAVDHDLNYPSPHDVLNATQYGNVFEPPGGYKHQLYVLWGAYGTNWSPESSGMSIQDFDVASIPGSEYVRYSSNGSSGLSTSDLPSGIDKRAESIWYIYDATDERVNFQFDLSENGSSDLYHSRIPIENYHLLRRSGTTGSFSIEDNATSYSNGDLYFDNYPNFISVYRSGYFTIGIEGVAPLVTTEATVTNIDSTTATSGGNATDDGGATITARGVCWSTSPNPTTANSHLTIGSGTGSFTTSIPSLEGNTTYYVRSFATNRLGTSYGDNVSFTTLPTATEPNLVDSTYQIATLENLYWMADDKTRWDFDYAQTADIDASATSTWYSDGSGGYYGWIPVGNQSDGYFTGNYNGQGYTIDGLYVNRSSTDEVGLFGRISGATIEKLGLTNISMTGNSWVGGITGLSNASATINNCYVTGSVTGNLNYTGGVCGLNGGSSIITDCYSRVTVSGNSKNGGILGYNSSSTVANCYATGTVSGSSWTGVLIGYESSGTVSRCFWDTESSGSSTGIGYSADQTATGKTTAEMKDYNTFTAAGWDFVSETANGSNDYWDADQDGNVNNGYMILSMQSGADNSLPVELGFFKAAIENGKIILTWQTESETENMGFILESRLRGEDTWYQLDDFNTNKLLEGQSSTVVSHDYKYIDSKITAGFTYEYRLSDVDYSGNITRHPIIDIVLPGATSHLLPGQFALQMMYPNPFNPSLNIRYETGDATHVRVTVFDLQGRELMTIADNQHQNGYHELIWQADHLPSGVYLVQIKSNSETAIKKVTLLK